MADIPLNITIPNEAVASLLRRIDANLAERGNGLSPKAKAELFIERFLMQQHAKQAGVDAGSNYNENGRADVIRNAQEQARQVWQA